MNRRARITRMLTRHVIWEQFPNSVRWRFDNVREHQLILIDYFGKGEMIFCVVDGTWYRIDYAWDSYFVSDEEGSETYPYVTSLVKTDPPSDVIYSHRIIEIAEGKIDIEELTNLVSGELGANLQLNRF